MQKRISKLADSLKRIGDIEVNDWDFAELLQRDIEDLHLGRSLRKLGSVRVTDWEFQEVLPAIQRLAHKEVDLVDVFRRAAAYRVTEWDFRDSLRPHAAEGPVEPPSGKAGQAKALAGPLGEFVRYVAVPLIEEPDLAEVRTLEIEPGVLRIQLVVTRRDSARLIGREGNTAAAMRRILQTAGLLRGVHVLLRIVSHEDLLLGSDLDKREEEKSGSGDS